MATRAHAQGSRRAAGALAVAALLTLACQRTEPELRVTYYYLQL
jgi:hypothetical protein